MVVSTPAIESSASVRLRLLNHRIIFVMNFISRIVSFALQIWATAGIAFKRLLTQRFLSLASMAGLMIASGFILSVPLYADATYFRLLREELLAGHEAD